ncbi:MAG: DMT family transporter [Phycisphaeraceae bacterium]|nr:DMT family transporter [Phycisphaeraceae bacterium]
MNAIRLITAVVAHLVIFRLITSDGFSPGAAAWWPTMEGRQVLLLALKGIVGLAIGDQVLFSAFVAIDPRLTNLLMMTAPLFGALLAFAVLGERLPALSILGMMVTIAGVGWVVLDRSGRTIVGNAHAEAGDPARRTQRRRGIVLEMTGAACQGSGLLLSKAGMGHGALTDDVPRLAPQAATLVRMSFAAIAVLPLLVAARWQSARRASAPSSPSDAFMSRILDRETSFRVQPQMERTLGRAVSRPAPAPNAGSRVHRWQARRTGLVCTLAGAICGPVFGVWLSLVAVDRTEVGVAQTLLTLSPIFILPWAAWIEREHIGMRAIVGAIVAIAGAGVLVTSAAAIG